MGVQTKKKKMRRNSIYEQKKSIKDAACLFIKQQQQNCVKSLEK